MSKRKRNGGAAAGVMDAASVQRPFLPYGSLLYLLVPLGLLVGLTVAYYAPSFSYPFQFDDIANISKNFEIRQLSMPTHFVAGPRWMGYWFDNVTFQIARFDPFYYRVIGLLIHLLAGCSLFFLIYMLCRGLKRNAFLADNALPISFCTAGLFLLHPVQTQTVSYVIQARIEGLATLFVILTILLFVIGMRINNLVGKGLVFLLAFATSYLACGAKELVIVLPFLAVLVDWFFIAEQNFASFKKRFFLYLALGVIVIGTMLRFLGGFAFLKQVFTLSMSTPNNRGNVLTDYAYDHITAGAYFISQFKVVLHYFVMFFVPLGLCVEYDWKLSHGFFAPDALFPFIALATLLGFVAYYAIRKQHSFFTFSVLWFLISVAPRSSIIPSSEMIVDYKSYLASVGVLFLISVLLVKLATFVLHMATEHTSQLQFATRRLGMIGVMLTVVGFSAYERNKVWSSAEAFWGDIIKKAPLKARVHNNYGVSLAEQGDYNGAIPHYLRAIELDRYYSDPLNNVSVSYTHVGEYEKAIGTLTQAISLFPGYPEAHNNRGSIKLRLKRYEAAERDFRIAIALRPHYGKAHYNMGRMFNELGESEKAWEAFRGATQGDLDTVEGFHTYAQMSIRVQKYDAAIDGFQQQLQALASRHNISPAKRAETEESILFNLANAHFMNKQLDHAEKIYERLVVMDSKEPRYVHNIGEVQFTRGEFPKAFETFQKAISLPATVPQSHIRIADCLIEMKRHDDARKYLNHMLEQDGPEDFKKSIKAELARVDLQEKLDANRGKIQMGDIGQTLAALSAAKSFATNTHG